MWRCQESVTSQAHYGRIFGWGGGVWGEGSENQHAAVSCGALHFQHGKSSGGCRGNKSQISTERTPLCSTPPYHPCSRLLLLPPSPSSSVATSQQIESCDLRPAYLGEQGSGSDQGSCPKLHSRSQSRSMCQRILVHSRQSSLFSSLFVFILLLPFTLYSNPSEGDLYP